ncbi:MAG: hypothetical protein ACJASQ_003278 [Crocinitomicaceae bacterium]|jgi:hypothetical protein
MVMTLDTFVALSASLTGYPASKLKPDLDTQKVAELFYDTLIGQAGPTPLAALNDAFLAISDPTDHESIKNKIFDNPETMTLAKIIIRMWYTGVWYYCNDPQDGFVVSSKGYINGLVWGTMFAHPMGYSVSHFGYWNEAPTTK